MTNWGIIGTGAIAKTFADDLKFVPSARLTAVASRVIDNAKSFALAYGCGKFFESCEALADESGVQAVYVATPHVLHARNALSCLRSGKAVLCEKPFTVNQAEASVIVSEARQRRVLLAEALWTVFQPGFQELLRITRDGDFGRILSIEADSSFEGVFDSHSRLFDPNQGGGSLLDMGIYNVALAHALLGEPETIEAEATFVKTGVDGSADVSLRYAGAVTAKLTCSVTKRSHRSATVIFEKGTVTIPDPWWHCSNLEIRYGTVPVKRFQMERRGYGFAPMIEAFQAHLCNGLKESPLVPFAASLARMRILDAIRQKIRLRYPADIEPSVKCV